MRVVHEYVAGIDVHKDMIKVAIRSPGEKRWTRKTEIVEFRTFYGVLQEMARELRRRRLAGEVDPEEQELLRSVDENRPRTRADCINGPRPCLFVSCKHNLYLDVNPETGSIKLNFPDKEIWELEYTCALDVAEKGGITLEEVGAIMNLTRERIRQVETRGLMKLREATEAESANPPQPIARVVDDDED